MRVTTVRLPDDLHAALVTVAEHTGVSQSDLLREAVMDMLASPPGSLDVPEDARKLAELTRIKRRNRWQQKRAWFYPRTHRYVANAYDEGVPPDLLADALDGYMREAALVDHDGAEQFVDDLLGWYSDHFTTNGPGRPFPTLRSFRGGDAHDDLRDDGERAKRGIATHLLDAVETAKREGVDRREVMKTLTQYHPTDAVAEAVREVFDHDEPEPDD